MERLIHLPIIIILALAEHFDKNCLKERNVLRVGEIIVAQPAGKSIVNWLIRKPPVWPPASSNRLIISAHTHQLVHQIYSSTWQHLMRRTLFRRTGQFYRSFREPETIRARAGTHKTWARGCMCARAVVCKLLLHTKFFKLVEGSFVESEKARHSRQVYELRWNGSQAAKAIRGRCQEGQSQCNICLYLRWKVLMVEGNWPLSSVEISTRRLTHSRESQARCGQGSVTLTTQSVIRSLPPELAT